MELFTNRNACIAWRCYKLRPPRLDAVFAVKELWKLVPDRLAPLEKDTRPVPSGDRHHDEDPAKSLCYSTDIALTKPKAEVMLVGHAYAPAQKPVNLVDVEIKVGGWAKKLVVTGDCEWRGKGSERVSHTEPEPFAEMPIVYERTFGGAGNKANPVGLAQDSKAFPNIRYPQTDRKAILDTRSAGFGPISQAWAPRCSRLGTYDETYRKKFWPWLPDDVDWRFCNSTPDDQQFDDYLTGDEVIELTNLHPQHARLNTRLPGTRTRLFILVGDIEGGELREVPLVLDTLAFFPGKGEAVTVWRGHITAPSYKLTEVKAAIAVRENLETTPRSQDDIRSELAERLARPEGEYIPGSVMDSILDAEKQIAEAENQADKSLENAWAQAEEARTKAAERGIDMEATEKQAPPILYNVFQENIDRMLATRRNVAPDDPMRDQKLAKVDAALAKLEEGRKKLHADLKPPIRAELEKAAFDKSCMDFHDLSCLDLTGADLTGLILNEGKVLSTRFADARLNGASLQKITFAETDLHRALLAEADLTGSQFLKATLREVTFTRATLADVTFVETDMPGVDFTGASLPGATFVSLDLTGADFTGADLTGATFIDCRLDKAIFIDGILVGSEWVNVTAESICAARAKTKGLAVVGESRLDKADFRLAEGGEANFRGLQIVGANFAGADMPNSVFADGILTGVSFQCANLPACDFSDARLSKVDCRDANLLQSTFDRATLVNCTLDRANMFGASLLDMDGQKTSYTGTNFKMTLLE